MGFEIGMSGSVSWGGAWANVVRWAANIQRDVHDGTVMVASTDPNYSWRRRILGHGSASGTVECIVDPAETSNPVVDYLGYAAPEGTAVLTLTTSEQAAVTYTGSVLCSNISVTAEVDGINRITFDFVSDGGFSSDNA